MYSSGWCTCTAVGFLPSIPPPRCGDTIIARLVHVSMFIDISLRECGQGATNQLRRKVQPFSQQAIPNMYCLRSEKKCHGGGQRCTQQDERLDGGVNVRSESICFVSSRHLWRAQWGAQYKHSIQNILISTLSLEVVLHAL